MLNALFKSPRLRLLQLLGPERTLSPADKGGKKILEGHLSGHGAVKYSASGDRK